MKIWCLLLAIAVPLSSQKVSSAEDPIFSGPQVGEKLRGFKSLGLYGDLAGKEFDIVEQAAGKPLLIIFVHERNRPSFGLTNAMMKFAEQRTEKGLHAAVIFLDDDPTKVEEWSRIVKRQLPQGVVYGISRDGKEGPGTYGLNRNVQLTVLVGSEGKVTANYALVQPGVMADGPKILKDVVAVTGGGEVPEIASLAGGYGMQRMERPGAAGRKGAAGRGADGKMAREDLDEKLTGLLRGVINKEATPEQVRKAAQEVEKYVGENEKARKQLGQIATNVTAGEKFSEFATQPARRALKRWAKNYGPAKEERGKESPEKAASAEKSETKSVN